MFQDIQPLRLPSTPVDGFTVQAASFGGGYILQLQIEGRAEQAVFADADTLTKYIQIMLSGRALAQGTAPAAPEAPKPVEAAAVPAKAAKRKGGRPKGAKNKPKLAVGESLNGAAPKETHDSPAKARESVEA